MKVITVIGQTYALRSMTGGDLTNEAGDVLETLAPGVQLHVTAQEPAWVLPDDCQVTACRTFKNASLAIRLLGGGNNGMPAGYTRVEYLGNPTGATYISFPDVYYVDNIVIDYTNILEGDRDFIVHAAKKGKYRQTIENYNDWYCVCIGDAADGEYSSDVVRNKGERVKIGVNYKTRKMTINDKEKTLRKMFPISFAASDVSLQIYRDVRLRVYSLRIEFEGREMSFVPALDKTGAPCLFDLVSRKPFYNSGTGDFIYPGKEATATTYSLRRPRMYAKMTERGIRRLYHVPRGYNGTPEEYAEQNGFKILVETPQPEEGYWAPVWHEREDCIELEWVETEPPAEGELLTEA